MGKGKGNGQADSPETSSWRCGICGMSGKCKKGDESTALAVHIALVHPPKKK